MPAGSWPAAGTAPAPLHEVHRQFSRNVLTTILARVVNMARGVVLVPFLLRHLGLEAYGIWTTIFILVSYVGVTTLGISNVYIKYVAEFHARREYDKANALLSTGLAITIPLCGAIFLGFWLGWNWYSPWLHLPPAHAADGKEAVLIVLGVFLSAIALNGFGDILTATQQIASTQWFLDDGHRGGAGRDFVAGGRRARHSRAWQRRIWCAFCSPTDCPSGGPGESSSGCTFRSRMVRRDSIRYVLHFGGLVQFQSMLSIFLASVERVAALGLIGAAAAGLLDVAKKWPTALSLVPMAFFAALLPATAHVDAASGDSDRFSEPAHALPEQLALRQPLHVGFCGRHRAMGRAHPARLAGTAVADTPGANRPVCGIQFGHAIPYAYRTGDFDVSRHGTRVRGVHLLDSQHRSAGSHVTGGALDRRPLDPARDRRGSGSGNRRLGLRADGPGAFRAPSAADALPARGDCAGACAVR